MSTLMMYPSNAYGIGGYWSSVPEHGPVIFTLSVWAAVP